MATARFIPGPAIADLADPADYVAAVRDGYRQVGEGAPARPRSTLTTDDGLLTEYTAILPETGAMGGYQYTGGFGSGDAWFVTPLFDAETGAPLAVLDGARFNPRKTGAVGGLATDVLARDDANTVGLFGSGRQAGAQLVAIATVRDLDRVAVFSPTRNHRESFATEMDRSLAATVTAVDTPRAAVRTADIVVTATSSPSPVFDGADLAPGTHVVAMGQYHPERRELDTATIERSRYVPDLTARVDRDAGAFIHAVDAGVVDRDHVHAELGAIVAGDAPGRESADTITVFDSGGTAIETVAAAHMLYERACERDRGTPIPFEPLSEAAPAPTDD